MFYKTEMFEMLTFYSFFSVRFLTKESPPIQIDQEG